MKRENGFLQINKFKVLKDQEFWKAGSFYEWLLIERKEYFYKITMKSDIYHDIIWSDILKYLKIPHVEYDLAIYDGTHGLISQNYNTNNDAIPLSKIIWNYVEQKKKENIILNAERLYNLQNLNQIYHWYFKNETKTVKSQVTNQTFLQFIIQVLVGNSDLHANNIEFLGKNHTTMSPFYDYDKYGNIDWNKTQRDRNFRLLAYPSENRNPTCTVQNFLQLATLEQYQLFKKYLEELKRMSMNQIITQSEERIESSIPIHSQNTLKRKLENHIEHVDEIVA